METPTQKRSTFKSSLNDEELNFSESGFLTDLSNDGKEPKSKQPVKSSRSINPVGSKEEIGIREED